MLVLALDTASVICAAGLVHNGKALNSMSETIGKGHAEKLMGQIEAVTSQANIALGEIYRLAVNIGPGSFTGVRVGVAAARGLALALDVPLIGISAFEALAFEAQSANRPVCVVLEAHRGALYTQSFANNMPLNQPEVMTAEEIAQNLPANVLLTGSGAEKIAAILENKIPVISDAPTAKIETYGLLAIDKEAMATPPSPLYMRAADAKPQTGFALPRC